MQKPWLMLYLEVLFSACTELFYNLTASLSKQQDLIHESQKSIAGFLSYTSNIYKNPLCPKCIQVSSTDHRFKNTLWSEQYPFNLYSQFFLCAEHILNVMTTNVPGVTRHNEHIVNFTLRQFMDVFSPSNFPWSNPLVIKAALEQGGINFIRGYLNFFEDVTHKLGRQPPVGTEVFQVGHDLAVTPGKVIYRNHLIELIQYTPVTRQVYSTPLLIVPAWIMKYYILDLSPYNSMVKFLVENGHTVFMISWKNPDAEDAGLGLEDYINLGIIDALKVINDILPGEKINCAGYCIGGTLLMLAASLMAARSDYRMGSITLFAAQVDFKDAGEILLFIDEKQITALEEIMYKSGYLSGEQMATCFSMLHSQDLVWSRYVQDYLLGTRYPLSDMMAWNADTTRLPYKMHSEYLRKLYLNNDFAAGKFKIKGKTLSLADIKIPIFAVSTVKDHVAPWKSVYKIHQLAHTDITYILTSGGHNSGIVSEPGHHDRSYQMLEHKRSARLYRCEEWKDIAPSYSGSWWVAWEKWLAGFSSYKIKPPVSENNGYMVLCDAPGTYVLQR